MAAHRRYTDEMLALMRTLADRRMYTREICAEINSTFGTSCTPAQVKLCMYRHGISNGMQHRSCLYTPLFPREVCGYIRTHVWGTRTRELREMVNRRFGREYTLEQIRSFLKNHGLRTGFKEGAHGQARK